jgi:cystathionine gamma-synthase
MVDQSAAQGSARQSSTDPRTLAVSLGRPEAIPGSGVNVAIELSTTFHADGAVVYGRDGNPVWSAFEQVVGGLEGGAHALTFGSGLAAINAVLSLVPTGGVVVAPVHPYSGSRARLAQGSENGRFVVRWVDITDADAVAAAMPGADLALLESPTNPLLELCDLRAAASAARAHGVVSVVDNTFSTPLVQRPLELGVDVVLHSGTKYLAGHSDALVGIVITNDGDLAERLATERSLGGGVAGPFEAYLALRGVRTLSVRMDRAMANASVLAERLIEHPGVIDVVFPGLPSHPQHALAVEQMHGFGAVIGVRIAGGGEAAERVSQGVRLWTHATSLGGVESLIERRRRLTFEHPDVPEDHLRLSVGIEGVDDLWADLRDAINRATGN